VGANGDSTTERAGRAARFASAEDEPALRKMSRDVPMVGAISYALEREPDFFAMTRLQGEGARVLVAEGRAPGELAAMATCIVERRRVAGDERRVCYAADLKVSPEARLRGFRSVMSLSSEAALSLGGEVHVTLVLAGNRAMLGIYERMKRPFLGRAVATVRAHSFFLGARVKEPEGPEVARARAEDLPEMVALWESVNAHRDLAPLFGAERLGHPGGPRLEDVLVARREGRVTGFAAVWDPIAVRQVRIHALSSSLTWLRRLYNPTLGLFGRPRIPCEGELLRALYLTYTCAEEPMDLAAILARARNEHRATGQLLLEVALDVKDPLAAAVEGLRGTHVDYTLLALARDEASFPKLGEKPVYLDLGLA
jgi:hypothetical protein